MDSAFQEVNEDCIAQLLSCGRSLVVEEDEKGDGHRNKAEGEQCGERDDNLFHRETIALLEDWPSLIGIRKLFGFTKWAVNLESTAVSSNLQSIDAERDKIDNKGDHGDPDKGLLRHTRREKDGDAG
jgi:hypothetical protein